MGVVGITVPEEYGGLGLDLVDVVLLLEEAGRAGLPEPLVETVAVGAPLLTEAPGPQGEVLRSRWLAALADGGATVAVGMSSMPAVPAAVGADLLLLERDGELHAVPAAAVVLTPRPALDGSRRLAQVDWEPSPATLVVSGFEAEEVLAVLGDRAALGTGAVLVGVADRLIAMAAQYAKERSQFGMPIGSFQAVKHHLADALVRVGVRPTDGLPRRRGRCRRASPTPACTLDGQGHGFGRRHLGGAHRAAGARRHRLHVGARPPSVDEAGVGARCVVG